MVYMRAFCLVIVKKNSKKKLLVHFFDQIIVDPFDQLWCNRMETERVNESHLLALNNGKQIQF